MSIKKYCYQVILQGPKSHILKRWNKIAYLKLDGLKAKLYFQDYTEAKAYLRAYLDSNLSQWVAAKKTLLLETASDHDSKPCTDIADDAAIAAYRYNTKNHDKRAPKAKLTRETPPEPIFKKAEG